MVVEKFNILFGAGGEKKPRIEVSPSLFARDCIYQLEYLRHVSDMLVYMYVGAQGSISSSGFTFSEVILLPSHGAGELRFERVTPRLGVGT